MTLQEITPFQQLILDELDKAEKKHPEFCDEFCNVDLSAERVARLLSMIRTLNYSGLGTAKSVLEEELLEALEAYVKGDYDACLQELAQCGAVIFRMMEFVDKKCKEN